MGLEYIVQPQVFLGGLTALGPGIQGLTENYPLLTTYYSWTSTASVNTSSFPIPIAVGSIYNGPGKEASFIISVGNVVQSPTEYTVDPILRTITFSSVVSAGIEFAATQLATASPSSQNFDYVKSVSAEFTTLTATNGSFNNLVVTNLTALSTTVNVIDIRISEVSGFRATGDVEVLGNVNVTNNINLTGNLIAASITSTSLTSTLITTNILSAREIDLVHTPANDGVDPILDIGETTTDGFSGIRVRYEESSNRLLVQTVAPSLTSNSIIIDRATGQVGISAIPNQALTVVGNISATGNLLAENLSKYFILSADLVPRAVSATVPFFDTNIPLNLQENKNYKINYDLYFLNLSAGSLRYVLSASNNLSSINCNFITTNALGISGATAATPQMASTFVVNSGIAVLTPFTTTGNAVFHNSLVQAIIQTGPACTFNISISGNTGTNFVTPKRGSSRVVQLME